jgi:aspartate kinase
MAIVVMKFGGSSVGDRARMRLVAQRIVARKRTGDDVVVVVSAMGDTTDELIDLALEMHATPSAREMDALLATGEQASSVLLTLALHALGASAIALTGWQAGIVTDDAHRKARIVRIDAQRIRNALASGYIVVVAGFQGCTRDGDIATLGRGGSDTTAVALASALNASVCDIYTDVDGVYSTDPRIVHVARKLSHISYDEMLELAHLGAAVLHPRAVECAKHNAVALVVRSSFRDVEGTIVKEEAHMEHGVLVRGIAYEKDVARMSLLGVPDEPGQLALVFVSLAEAGINVDIIVQSGVVDGKADFSFTISEADVDEACDLLRRMQPRVRYADVTCETKLVKISIVGAGMVSNPGVAAQMFRAISEQGVSIKMVSTSEIKVSAVIDGAKWQACVQALHTAFGLDASEVAFVGGPSVRR